MAPGAWKPAVAVAALAGAATIAIISLPTLRFAFENPSLAVALATAEGLTATVVAFLVYGRFRRTGHADDLVLLVGLAMLALSNLVFRTIATIVPDAFRDSFIVWAPRGSRLVGAAALLVAAWMAVRPVPDLRRALAWAAGAVAAAVALVSLFTSVLSPVLRPHPDPPLPAAAAATPNLSADPVTNVTWILLAVFFAAATIGFARKAERTGDRLLEWFAVATPLAALASVNQLLFSSGLPGIVFVGDVMRVSFYGILLIGAALEIGSYWRGLAESQVLEERRRMARELHDGLAQELAFIVARTGKLHPNGEAPEVRQIRSAAERALDESRRAIAALTRPVDESLDSALGQVLNELGNRIHARLEVEAPEGVACPPDTREELLRIAREAVTNADRHGEASIIQVRLSDADGLRMSIVDDGRGFDPATAGADGVGFGLISMRERAEALGAEFRLVAAPGAGTRVEVVLR